MTVTIERRRQMLRELAEMRAGMVRRGVLDLHTGVDALAELAVRFGIETDEAQAIIARPFRQIAEAIEEAT